MGGPRVLVVWCPDWPVVTALREADLPGHLPAAVFSANNVQACNDAARELGVRRGMRRRDAQARCPELRVLPASPDRDGRAFEEVLVALEQLRPGVAPLRPGLVALRSPGRFYGGEAEAGAVLAERLVTLGVRDVRVGVADELFTAEQAARRAPIQGTVVVPPGESAAFLCELPIEVLDVADDREGAEAVSLLQRLGIRTLGDLAGLPDAAEVEARFGHRTAWAYRVVHGRDRRALAGRVPPPELACEVGFEPPLVSAETVCFSAKQAAERFVAQLAHRQLACTEVLVEVFDDSPGRGSEPASARRWLHPRWFSAVDLVDRLHWQLQGSLQAGDVRSAVSRVRFVPEEVVPESVHADGLWGGTDARVERGIARVQGMLGHESVVAPVLQGGRSPADRQAFVPWGERAVDLRPPSLPWPGSIPPPAPARVLRTPWPAEVLDSAGRPVAVLERGAVSSEPARFRPGGSGVDGAWQHVSAWAGPWPVQELWWEEGRARRVARFQLVGLDGRAWLVTYDSAAGAWITEAAYD